MKTFFSVLIFFVCLAIGFSVGPTLYAISLAMNLIDIEATKFDQAAMQYGMMVTQVTWLICALFSFSSFFLRGYWKSFFLATPIVLPTLCWIIMAKDYIAVG
ncbi:MAG: hypothetical protein ACRBCK_06810 [Alphaproteobacteria bacterium]